MRLTILLSVLPVFAQGAKWAVIAAGSKSYSNYRHQADACHAYQLMKKSGIPESNIILMMQDDVAHSSRNPFPGKLFNKPGNNVEDVYDGCNIDYRGSVVTHKLFSAVITGDESGVPANGKVLKSGPDDKVFLNFADHGGVGIIAFPNGGAMHASTLAANIKTMQQKKMFKEMVFYMEACESGSMFPDLTSGGKVLAVTASNAHESSYAAYCGSQARVNGRSIGSCLGDVFSVKWMEDSDKGAFSSETLQTQINLVKQATSTSHVSIFGDTSFESEPIGNFENKMLRDVPLMVPTVANLNAIDVRDIDVHEAYEAWKDATTPDAKREAWKRFMAISAQRNADETLFENIVKESCSDVNMIKCFDHFRHARLELKDLACHKKLVDTVSEKCPSSELHASPGGWNGFNMRFSQVLANLCEGQQILGKDTEKFDGIVKKACGLASSQALIV